MMKIALPFCGKSESKPNDFAFSFKNKTHFSDMKCGPLSVNGVPSCLQTANICHKINFKLPTPSF